MKFYTGTLVLILFTVPACTETFDAEYSSLQVAREKNAVKTGLVPNWLPETSQQIKVTYDLDTNEIILAFQYKITEGWNPPLICNPIGPFDTPEPKLQRSWWPQDVPANHFSAYRHTYYNCKKGNSFLAILPDVGEAFYWNAGD